MADIPRILFVHVPKTAGISLYRALARSLGKERAIRFPTGSDQEKEKYLSMADEELGRFHLVSGHFPLPFFLKKPLHDYTCITVLREPVDRELSAYFYMKTWDKHPLHQQMQSMDLYAYLREREQRNAKNPQCWHICGESSFARARTAIDEQYSLAAPMEYIPQFCRVLERRLDLPAIELKHDNKTRFRLTAEEIHPDIKARFEALAEEDSELYRYVKEKFESEILGNSENT